MKITMMAMAACMALGVAAGAQAKDDHSGHSAMAKKKQQQQPWGIAGEARAATRTIAVKMTDDMRFHPAAIEVRQGETIRFTITNAGKMLHEMVIGTPQALDEHAARMQASPGMPHDAPHMAHVPAGGSRDLVWTFNRPGDFRFACLIPGHYQAGMVGTIKVSAVR